MEAEHVSLTTVTLSPDYNMSAPENVSLQEKWTTSTVYRSSMILGWSLVIAVVGIVGNTFVIVVILKTSHLKGRLANMMITNQSFIDLVSCIFLIGSATVTDASATDDLAGELYCRLWLSSSCLWGLVFASTYCLIALTVERYLGVVHPVWHRVCFTKFRAKVVMVMVWVLGLTEGAAHSIPTSYVKDGTCFIFSKWPNEVVRRTAGIVTCALHYILPIFVLVYCYGRMAALIMSKMKRVAATEEGQSSQQPKAKGADWSKAKRNVVHTLALVSLMFALCWSFNQIYYLMFNLGYEADFSSDFYNFTVLAIYFNSCVNPLVYIVKYDQFRVAALRFIRTREDDVTTDNTTTHE